ncbi:hypothetical protein [Chryseobacterium sp. c4a]|uniref:hypothetical protein n=1 Tax=Chryseobacterium sp. c4a TaxID=1573582 RepID=UPI00135CA94C|nr:hypothetical protein [Chryseobacterium sp. c4a]
MMEYTHYTAPTVFLPPPKLFTFDQSWLSAVNDFFFHSRREESLGNHKYSCNPLYGMTVLYIGIWFYMMDKMDMGEMMVAIGQALEKAIPFFKENLV